MLSVRADHHRRRRPNLHGLAQMLLLELSPAELAQLEELIVDCRPLARDFAEERGFPRSVISCIFRGF